MRMAEVLTPAAASAVENVVDGEDVFPVLEQLAGDGRVALLCLFCCFQLLVAVGKSSVRS